MKLARVDDSELAIAQYVATHPLLTTSQLATALKRSRPRIASLTAELRRKRLLEAVSLGTSEHRFRITKTGRHYVDVPGLNEAIYWRYVGLTGRPLVERRRSWQHDFRVQSWALAGYAHPHQARWDWESPPFVARRFPWQGRVWTVCFDAIAWLHTGDEAAAWGVEYATGSRHYTSALDQMNGYVAYLEWAHTDMAGLLVICESQAVLDKAKERFEQALRLGPTGRIRLPVLFALRASAIELGPAGRIYESREDAGLLSPLDIGPGRRCTAWHPFAAGALPKWRAVR